MEIQNIIKKNSAFLTKEPNIYFSPGRVNLIGEHIDYLGGNVFPTAINLGTYAFVTKRDDMEIHFLSYNFPEQGEKIVHLHDLKYRVKRNWANYPTGVLQDMIGKGLQVTSGLNILIYGTLPNSAGLSSSASLEVLMATVLKEEFNFEISMLDIVKLSQNVENNYIGVNCGIMDQFAVGMSRINKAIYLNTNTLEYELVPLELGEYTLVIANTNKKRALAESSYNERRSQSDLGLEILQLHGVKAKELCDITVEEFETVKHHLEDPIIKNRVEHGVYENHRVSEAVDSLTKGDIKRFGELMDQSHNSCRDLYEVSCRELDVLVDAFRKNKAIGARMTGAGFGGCAIALVPTKDLEESLKNVKDIYVKEVGYNADFYPVKTHDGTSKIKVEV